jgi:hypothetical protein
LVPRHAQCSPGGEDGWQSGAMLPPINCMAGSGHAGIMRPPDLPVAESQQLTV